MHVRVIPFCITWSRSLWRYLIRSAKFFIRIYGINSYRISQHNLLLPVSNSFHTYNYGFVFNMAWAIGFLRSDNYTVLIFICLSREVWRQFQLVSHDHFLWPSSFCLDSSPTIQSAAPWLPLLYLGFLYCGFGCKHGNGVCNRRR